ncbi:MAG: DoxX family protein [Ferruginibacter sp.]
MKKLFSARYSAGAFNTAMFVLRVGFGVLIANHGYDKLQHFEMYKTQFINFMGMGQSVSLSLVIFAELGCGILLVLGFATRLASIPLIITMLVALTKVHNWQVFDFKAANNGEMPCLYLLAFIVILCAGPGKASVDGMISK